MIPRLRGKIGVIEAPEDLKGQFAYEITLWNFEGTHQIEKPIGPFGPFKTEAEAAASMKKTMRIACEEIEMRVAGETSGHYMDLKNGGVTRPWDEH